MTDIKALFEEAKQEVEKESEDPLKLAISEVIRIERRYYYAEKNRSGRLKELRDVVTKYSDDRVTSNADQ